jgi:hypothetical protein
MGVDVGWGSSPFGIVASEWKDDLIEILYADEFHRPDFNEMLSKVYERMSKYQVDKVYIDGSAPSFIRSLKIQVGEDPEYEKVIARAKAEGFDDEAAVANMKVVPVNFAKSHKDMLGHAKLILESDNPRRIAINPVFDKLITSLRTAVDKDGSLDKEQTSFNDILDAFRLALKFYQWNEG